MAGLKIMLSSAFTDTSLPVLRKDKILTAGSLFLFDPSHSTDPIAGVPANLATTPQTNGNIPNIAWEEAAALIGSGSQATLAGTFNIAGQASNTLILERTPKGSLHGIVSQTNVAAVVGAKVLLPNPVRQWLVDHPTHTYYMSLQFRPTRQAIVTGLSGNVQPAKFLVSGSSVTAAPLGYLTTAGLFPNSSTLIGSEVSPGVDSLAECFVAGAWAGWTGTAPAALANIGGAEFGFGALSGFTSASWYNKAGSHVLRRFYLEDLTASGRSFATVRDLDKANWTYEISAGGRWYGDTWTAPAI